MKLNLSSYSSICHQDLIVVQRVVYLLRGQPRNNPGMVFARSTLLLIFVLLTSFSALAGMEKEGYSRQKGIFYTFVEGGHIGFESPDQALELSRHCVNGGYVYRLTSKRKYKCHFRLGKNQVANEEEKFGVIEILGHKGPNYDMKYDLFSTTRLQQTKWQSRPSSEEETQSLNTLVSSNRVRYGRMDLKKAFVVSKPNATQITVIVPGKWVRSENYEAQRHHIFIGHVGSFLYQGQIPDRPERYYDVNGDWIPEVQTNESCDGWCIRLWDISHGPRQIADFGGH